MPHFYDSDEFIEKFTYTGNDLGASWSPEHTVFRVWAPTARAVSVLLYASGDPNAQDQTASIPMEQDVNGTWRGVCPGDLNGVYYTYQLSLEDRQVCACDPYARAVGVNGQRAMVIDLAGTNPAGWESDQDPNGGIPLTDAVIYEAHIRDLTMDPDSGIQHKGKYLGLIEAGTKNPSGCPTGLDHMKALGISHLHILPMYDFGFTDESLPEPQYNWGYDPVNFNVPEGSYSTDPCTGAVRVQEVKQMVKGLHDNGISVVMDVVYNHVYDAESFCFNRIVPMYFSRQKADGSLMNDACCGNDTASERVMVRKFIVDSVKYWADEYHIDGFRFDLVGLIDTETINQVMDTVHRDHPNVIFYGEGWDMYSGPQALHEKMTIQKNSALVPGFAFFNDSIRDLLRGSVFFTERRGFVSGGEVELDALANCYRGAPDWASTPSQSVNYVSCHDNNTLFDRIALSTPGFSRAKRIRMNHLAAAFCLTARGIPFLQAGEELLRTKPRGRGKYDENSYRTPDSVNAIKWSDLDKREYRQSLAFYQGLLALRRAYPLLRENNSEGYTRLETGRKDAVAFLIQDRLCAVFNPGMEPLTMTLPQGTWEILVKGAKAGTVSLGHAQGSITVDAISALILRRV